MQKPLRFRNSIPFYYDKSEEEFRLDKYERYDPMVIRQSMIHLCDDVWGLYPWQDLLDRIEKYLPDHSDMKILEIGCGVGRMIGSIANKNRGALCWGVDYSYQMLKRARETWLTTTDIDLDLSHLGFKDPIRIEGKSLSNLKLGLAKCESLPFEDRSQDLVFSSFLLDRLSNPLQALTEMKRVVTTKGKVIVITPFNLSAAESWSLFYPMSRCREQLQKLGFDIVDWQDEVIVNEPLDVRENMLRWNCSAIILQKKE